MPLQPVITALRAATGEAHAELEIRLGLLEPPLRRARFSAVLAGFHGFHRAMEPVLRRWIQDDAFLAPRTRLDGIEADLRALGAETPRGGPDTPDLRFIDSRPAAWGALYVLEGSALGGQVISRAVAQADWAPAAGLSYFNPYGSATGVMWRQFRYRLEAEVGPAEVPAAAMAARATFKTLVDGLPTREPVA